MQMSAFESFADRLARRLQAVDAPAAPGPGSIHAAVALLLRPAAGVRAAATGEPAEVLFIKRAERRGDPWSGHIALPGGRPEPGDAGLLDVALRETLEEVGIDVRRAGRVLGRLGTVEPLSVRLPPIDVTPFVAVVPAGAAARPDRGEVVDAFWLSLAALRESGASEVVTRVIRGQRRQWPAYPSPAGPIWGITHRILTELLARAGASPA